MRFKVKIIYKLHYLYYNVKFLSKFKSNFLRIMYYLLMEFSLNEIFKEVLYPYLRYEKI